MIRSPIKGGKGNTEFLAHIILNEEMSESREKLINSVIRKSLFDDDKCI